MIVKEGKKIYQVVFVLFIPAKTFGKVSTPKMYFKRFKEDGTIIVTKLRDKAKEFQTQEEAARFLRAEVKDNDFHVSSPSWIRQLK